MVLIDKIPAFTLALDQAKLYHPICFQPVQDQLQQRLQSLRSEYEAGQRMLTELEAKQTNLRDTLLRISGAIQVLEEMLSKDDDDIAEQKDVEVEVE